MDITQFIVACCIHFESEGVTRHDFSPGEKNLVEKGRKMVKNGENEGQTTNAHAWTPYKPNIFSITVPVLTLHIRSVYEVIPQADRGPWTKNWTAIGGRSGKFWRYQQRHHSLRYVFESRTASRLQRRLELSPLYYRRTVRRLWTRSFHRELRTEGPSGREPIGPPPPTMLRFNIQTAISAVSAQVR